MTHSSQAGLASIRYGQATQPDRPTIVIRTESGVAFELSLSRSEPDTWAVIASIGVQSTAAEAMVGMSFVALQPETWHPRGYAMVIQRELNAHYESANIITEVPL